MIPFDTVNDAIAWIESHCIGDVGVYIWNRNMILEGLCYPNWRYE